MLEHFEDEKQIFTVTEFMAGGDLHSYISKSKVWPLDETRTRKIFL